MLRADAVLFTAEVRGLALETLVVGEFEHCIGLHVIEVGGAWVFQGRVILHSLELDSLLGLLPYFLLEAEDLDHKVVDDWQVRSINLVFLAGGAIREAESNAGRQPTLLQNLDQTVHMEDVLARQQHRWGLAKARCVADCAEFVIVLTF